MTLKELIALKLIRDNVQVLEFTSSADGLGSLKTLCDCVRSFGIVDVERLCKAGLDQKYLDYDVIEIWGTKNIHKIGIVVEEVKL